MNDTITLPFDPTGYSYTKRVKTIFQHLKTDPTGPLASMTDRDIAFAYSIPAHVVFDVRKMLGRVPGTGLEFVNDPWFLGEKLEELGLMTSVFRRGGAV
jgi:hypothetical protein